MTETVLRADALLGPDGVVADAELAFDGTGAITYVGAVRAAQPARDNRVVDLSGHVLMPGLVNGHTHSAMTLLRGVSDDAGFMPWLAAVQAMEQHLTRQDVAAGLKLAMLEMIETGTVAFADMYHWDAGLIEIVRSAGMRASVALASFSPESIGFPGVAPWNGEQVLDRTEELAARYADDPHIRVAFGPHAPYTCPPEFLREVRDRAIAGRIPVHIHVSESAAEVADIQQRYGRTPGEHLDGLGFFDAEVLAAHCVHLTDPEIARFAEAGVAVSHNPVSNLKLGNGVADLPEWRRAGLRVSLGTDSVASNNTLDLFEETKLAAMLHRGVHQDAGIITAREVLDIATRGGAAALGFDRGGVLEVGAHADVIALDVRGTAAAPLEASAEPDAVISHLGFTATGADVRHVFIGGRHVYAEGRHLTLDAEKIRAEARAARVRLRAAARDAAA